MEDILEFFVYLFTETVIGIEQSNKSSKGFRLFVFILLVMVMFLLLELAFLYRNNNALIWAILIFALFIILFIGSLWTKFIKLKNKV